MNKAAVNMFVGFCVEMVSTYLSKYQGIWLWNYMVDAYLVKNLQTVFPNGWTNMNSSHQ